MSKEHNVALIDMLEKNRHFIDHVQEQMQKQKDALHDDFERLNSKVETRLEGINDRVEGRLRDGFSTIDTTFKDIVSGISKISQAQQNITNLSHDITDLQQILSDKKSRGVFGEVQLNAILRSIFGQHEELYAIQHRFMVNGRYVISDAVIKAPSSIGWIAVDSKFPLENYQRMLEDKSFAKAFKRDIKKHISDIASRYIIPAQTANMAIMFLPAEAIFAEIYASHPDLVDFSQEMRVWIASPTTFMAILTTIQAVVRDIKMDEQAKTIQNELKILAKNFTLYRSKWETLTRRVESVNKEIQAMQSSAEKIVGDFERIEGIELKWVGKNPTTLLQREGSLSSSQT